jgi:hypothetical protein
MGILNTQMQRFGKEILARALTLLAEVMAHRGHPPCHFVVCGGSSLLALDLISRTTTRDVDVLARLEAKHLVQAKPLPDAVVEAAESVRSQLNLPKTGSIPARPTTRFFGSDFRRASRTDALHTFMARR